MVNIEGVWFGNGQQQVIVCNGQVFYEYQGVYVFCKVVMEQECGQQCKVCSEQCGGLGQEIEQNCQIVVEFKEDGQWQQCVWDVYGFYILLGFCIIGDFVLFCSDKQNWYQNMCY